MGRGGKGEPADGTMHAVSASRFGLSSIWLALATLIVLGIAVAVSLRADFGPFVHGFLTLCAGLVGTVGAVMAVHARRAPSPNVAVGPVDCGTEATAQQMPDSEIEDCMLEHTGERARAEELLRQKEILLDTVPDGILGLDHQGLVSFANPAAAGLLRATTAALTGKPLHELLHGPDGAARCKGECQLRRAAGHRVSSVGEDTILRADGSSFPAEYFLTPIVEQGHFSGSALSFRDISQRSALDHMKDEFVSTVSHELRTPLTSIRGALGLLSSGILGDMNEKGANLLRIALSNSDRLVRLINDILDLERIQSGREPLAFQPVVLADVVRQSIDGMQPMADAAGVRLIHETSQVEVAGDFDRLLQVLTNLLSNAIKFSPPDSTISVVMRPGADGVTLSVIDQGRGIPADKLELIFGRFQQVDVSDSRQKGGSGLGLAICRTIVMQHSGRIWAERNPVRGSAFHVYLPYQPVVAVPSDREDVSETVTAR